jgi:hypothetical protein
MKERVTVSLDAEVAAQLKGAAEQAGAASVSEYVQSTIEDRFARELWLARWTAAVGEPDPVALDYATRRLRGEDVEPPWKAAAKPGEAR